MSRVENLILPLLLIGGLPLTALANSDPLLGKVGVQGSIIEASCTIDVGSRDQSIDMGVIPIGQINRDGRSAAKFFSIRLIHCLDSYLANKKNFYVTFDGKRDGNFIGVEGNAEGIALQFTDDRGNIARPGVPLPSAMQTSDKKTLNYSLYLIPNYQKFRSGEYRTVVRFKMDYY